MNESVVHKKRNSLIELFRFLFAMNVMIGHGLFPIKTEHFGPDRISVEFFFILSGYLFALSVDKYRNEPLGQALWKIATSKIKPLLIPTVIGLISNAILNYLTNYNPLKMFRYLWYIPAMIIAFLILTALRILIKSDKRFWLVVAGIFAVTTVLRFSGSEVLFFFDYLRSALAVSLGMLLTKIPKLPQNRKWVAWVILMPVAMLIFYIVYQRLASDEKLYEALLDIVLYPILIYATFNIDFHLPVFNYIGALSFGLYAFQCPARLLANTVTVDPWIPFILIVALTLIEDTAKRIIKHKKGRIIGVTGT